MLSQVILASKTKFVYKFIQKVFQSQGINCYTAEEGESFGFQIDELSPQLVLVNLKDLDWPWVRENLTQAQNQNYLKVALAEDVSKLDDEVKNFFHHLISLPVEPFELVEKLKQLQGGEA